MLTIQIFAWIHAPKDPKRSMRKELQVVKSLNYSSILRATELKEVDPRSKVVVISVHIEPCV